MSVHDFVIMLNMFYHSPCSCTDCMLESDYNDRRTICSVLCKVYYKLKLEGEFSRMEVKDFIEVLKHFETEGEGEHFVNCEDVDCSKCILYKKEVDGEKICKILVNIDRILNEGDED